MTLQECLQLQPPHDTGHKSALTILPYQYEAVWIQIDQSSNSESGHRVNQSSYNFLEHQHDSGDFRFIVLYLHLASGEKGRTPSNVFFYFSRWFTHETMNDRLGDLGGGGANWADEDDDGNGGSGGDVEMGNTTPSQPKHMEHFFREVESIKADIEQVKKATKTIGEINEAAIHATTTDEENDLSNRLRPVVDQTNKRAKRTKTLLGLLKEETKKLKDDGTGKASDLRYVIRIHC